MPENAPGAGCYYHKLGAWVIADRGVARAALGNPQFSSRVMETGFYLPADARAECADLLAVLGRWFVMLDGEEHRSARRRVGSIFSPAGLRDMRGEVESIVGTAVDGFASGDGGDAVEQLANVISARTIAHIVGLADVGVDRLHGWARAVAEFIAASYRVDLARQAQNALWEMGEALEQSGHEIWALGGNNDRDRLATCSMLLFGGLETTASLIGMALWYMLENDLVPLLSNADSMPEAEAVVEQVLAFRPPLGHVARTALTDVETGECPVPAGDPVVVSLTGQDPFAGHAPPEGPPVHIAGGARMDHLAFGKGAHYCIGAALARMEASLALHHFARRMPRARLRSLRWSRNRTYRGLERLDIGV